MGLFGKADAEGVVKQRVTDAMSAARGAAAANGLALDEAESTSTSLTFKKGAKLFSWGSTVVVQFDEVGPTETRVVISVKETFAAIDWGRSGRLAQRLLEGISAVPA